MSPPSIRGKQSTQASSSGFKSRKDPSGSKETSPYDWFNASQSIEHGGTSRPHGDSSEVTTSNLPILKGPSKPLPDLPQVKAEKTGYDAILDNIIFSDKPVAVEGGFFTRPTLKSIQDRCDAEKAAFSSHDSEKIRDFMTKTGLRFEEPSESASVQRLHQSERWHHDLVLKYITQDSEFFRDHKIIISNFMRNLGMRNSYDESERLLSPASGSQAYLPRSSSSTTGGLASPERLPTSFELACGDQDALLQHRRPYGGSPHSALLQELLLHRNALDPEDRVNNEKVEPDEHFTLPSTIDAFFVFNSTKITRHPQASQLNPSNTPSKNINGQGLLLRPTVYHTNAHDASIPESERLISTVSPSVPHLSSSGMPLVKETPELLLPKTFRKELAPPVDPDKSTQQAPKACSSPPKFPVVGSRSIRSRLSNQTQKLQINVQAANSRYPLGSRTDDSVHLPLTPPASIETRSPSFYVKESFAFGHKYRIEPLLTPEEFEKTNENFKFDESDGSDCDVVKIGRQLYGASQRPKSPQHKIREFQRYLEDKYSNTETNSSVLPSSSRQLVASHGNPASQTPKEVLLEADSFQNFPQPKLILSPFATQYEELMSLSGSRSNPPAWKANDAAFSPHSATIANSPFESSSSKPLALFDVSTISNADRRVHRTFEEIPVSSEVYPHVRDLYTGACVGRSEPPHPETLTPDGKEPDPATTMNGIVAEHPLHDSLQMMLMPGTPLQKSYWSDNCIDFTEAEIKDFQRASWVEDVASPSTNLVQDGAVQNTQSTCGTPANNMSNRLSKNLHKRRTSDKQSFPQNPYRLSMGTISKNFRSVFGARWTRLKSNKGSTRRLVGTINKNMGRDTWRDPKFRPTGGEATKMVQITARMKKIEEANAMLGIDRPLLRSSKRLSKTPFLKRKQVKRPIHWDALPAGTTGAGDVDAARSNYKATGQSKWHHFADAWGPGDDNNASASTSQNWEESIASWVDHVPAGLRPSNEPI